MKPLIGRVKAGDLAPGDEMLAMPQREREMPGRQESEEREKLPPRALRPLRERGKTNGRRSRRSG